MRAINLWAKDKINPGSNVLMVASGGDTAFALSSMKQVAKLEAVDLNIGQIHCCRLKQAALIHLSTGQFIEFFMNDNNQDTVDSKTEANREKVFKELSASLPKDTVQYWIDKDKYTQLIKGGLHSFGFRQHDCVGLVIKLRDAGLHPFENGLKVLSEDKKEAWDNVWKNNLLSKMPKQPGVRIGELVRQALLKGDVDNWFVRSFFGRPSPNLLPVFLQNHSFILQNKTYEKINFEYKELNSALEESASKGIRYDLIHISTVLDGLTPDFRHKLLTSIQNALSATGIALFRSGPFEVGLNLRELVSKYLTIDETISNDFKNTEKCLIYFDVVCARKANGSAM